MRWLGVSEVIRPANFDVANAIGVTIAQVSGQIEKIYSLVDWGARKRWLTRSRQR
ncbi:UNVERIFIED_CONTAM: hypothetical protein ABID98_005155 [Brevibacillus sp. OAP136]